MENIKCKISNGKYQMENIKCKYLLNLFMVSFLNKFNKYQSHNPN